MNPTAIKEYIARLPFTDFFLEYPEALQDKILFGASEILRFNFGAAVITDELIALQAVYLAEGEKEEFAKFKRHDVTTMRLEDISFSFDKEGNDIAPSVSAIIGKQREEAEKAAKEAADAPVFGRLF